MNSDSPVKKLFVIADADSRRDGKPVCTNICSVLLNVLSNLFVCYSRVYDIYFTVTYILSYVVLCSACCHLFGTSATGKTSALESPVSVVSVNFTSSTSIAWSNLEN